MRRNSDFLTVLELGHIGLLLPLDLDSDWSWVIAFPGSPTRGRQILRHLSLRNHVSPFPINIYLSIHPFPVYMSAYIMFMSVYSVYTCTHVHPSRIHTREGEALGGVWTRSHRSLQVWGRRLVVTNRDDCRDDQGWWWDRVQPTLERGTCHTCFGPLQQTELQICLIFFP